VAHASAEGTTLTYTLLRLGSRQIVQVELAPIPQGNSVLYFILAAVGIFTLGVGAFVSVKRPADPATPHFFWMCVAFFGVFTFSFSGRLDRLDWVFYWADVLAGLLLPPLFLHLAVVFPERSVSWIGTTLGSRLFPLVYLPALLLGAARVMSVGRLGADPRLIDVVAALDRAEPAYFALCLLGGIVVLVRARGTIRSLTGRRQLRWILWGTLLGGGPCAVGYALPFALGLGTSVRMELLAIPLGIIPLAFASAIVRYRLMDVEVIVKRGLVYVAAASAIVAIYAVLYRAVGGMLLENRLQHNTIIAGLATLVMVLLARPMKDAIQNILDRAFYRDRYD
jgi:two-component system NtrC family sensor kinase